MTIKAKLYLNMLLTVTGIVLIGGFSLIGMRFVQGKLTLLTERSTPYQLKSIDLQRVLQEHISNLLKVASARNSAELEGAKGGAEKSLAEVKRVSADLAAFKGGDDSGEGGKRIEELARISADLLRTSTERLNAGDSARRADTLMRDKLRSISSSLREMDGSMRKLQKGAIGQLSSSNEGVKKITQRLKSVQEATNSLNNVKSAVLELSAADGKAGVTIAQSRFNAASKLLAQSALAKGGGTVGKELTDGVGELTKEVMGGEGLVALKQAILAKGAANASQPAGQPPVAAPAAGSGLDELKKKFAQELGVVNQKLAQLNVLLSDSIEKTSDEVNSEGKKFDDSLKGTAGAGETMGLAGELTATGADISSLIRNLFNAATIQEINALKGALAGKFDHASSLVKRISSASGRGAGAVAATLADIRGLLFARDGVIEKLQRVISVNAEAQAINDKLRQLVEQQREEARQGTTRAQSEQEQAVKSVNAVFRGNITGVTIVALVTLVVGIIVSKLLQRSIINPVREMEEIAQGFGNGDFSRRMDEGRKDEFGRLAVHFNQATGKLNEITHSLRSAIDNLSGNARQLNSIAHDLAQGAASQATQTDQSASAMTEMSQTITEVAQNAVVAAEATREALGTAATGKDVVEKTSNGMMEIADSVRAAAETISRLGDSSVKIGSIIDVINEIADQTNLLALNAAIEAARAGEMGKGFAVVADEVRQLAQRTGSATSEIAAMVKGIQHDTEASVKSMASGRQRVDEGVKLADEASRALVSILDVSNRGADMVQRIATAAEEQSAVAGEVTASMEEINSITRKSSASVAEISNASAELTRLADELQQMAQWFKTGGEAASRVR